MRRCSRCGAEIKIEGNFCQNCGARLDRPRHVSHSNDNLIDRFGNANIIIKIIIVLIALFLLLLIFSYAANLFFGFPLEPYTEGEATYRSSEFDRLDVDGDGALSFYEVEGFAPDISHDGLLDLFDSADKNDNSLLKGSEFDGFVHRVENYHKDLEKQKTSKEKRTSSSSRSNPYFEDEGHETCPICGSDQISEFYNEQYGEMNWMCDDCGEIMRSEDDMYINYWEEQGITCILPCLSNNPAVI